MEILSLNTLNMNGGKEGTGSENASKYKIVILKTLERERERRGSGSLLTYGWYIKFNNIKRKQIPRYYVICLCSPRRKKLINLMRRKRFPISKPRKKYVQRQSKHREVN